VGYTTTEDSHFRRLAEVTDWSYRQQKNDRKIHQMLGRFMAGEYYPFKDATAGPHTAIPLLSMAARAMSRHLISKEPRALVNTQIEDLKTWAENQELSTNRRVVTSDAASVLVTRAGGAPRRRAASHTARAACGCVRV